MSDYGAPKDLAPDERAFFISLMRQADYAYRRGALLTSDQYERDAWDYANECFRKRRARENALDRWRKGYHDVCPYCGEILEDI